MAEVEVMVREFLEMKLEEVKHIVIKQEKVLYSNHKPVAAMHEMKLRWTVDQGRELMRHYEMLLSPKEFFDRVVNFHHKTDISREGRVDVTEFMNAAPIFLMPIPELRREGLFFRAAMQSEPRMHEEHAKHAHKLRMEGKTHEQAEAECNQQ